MSRSRRKNPIIGHTTATSEKWFKKKQHHKTRAKVNGLLRAARTREDVEDLLVPDEAVVGAWGPKDGKQYVAGATWEILNK